MLPLLNENEEIKIILDGVAGYPASFIEEAFGGLIRSGIELSKIKTLLKIVAKDEVFSVYSDLAWEYMSDADAAFVQ